MVGGWWVDGGGGCECWGFVASPQGMRKYRIVTALDDERVYAYICPACACAFTNNFMQKQRGSNDVWCYHREAQKQRPRLTKRERQTETTLEY
jgi:hypothetical protein